VSFPIPDFFSKAKQSFFGTPRWALEKINEAKEKKLESLDLSRNYLDKREQLVLFPDQIFALSKLTELNLMGNRLNELPMGLAGLSNLRILNLKLNKLTILPEWIYALYKLMALDVGYNQLSALPEAISQLQGLTYLDVSNNKLSELPASIDQLQNLTHLDLSYNHLSTLPASITRLQSLAKLSLNCNQLSILPESINQLSNLQDLDLTTNQLVILPASIGQLKSLTALDLRVNQLRTLPGSIRELHNLTYLRLGGNPLGTLPASIYHLHNLTYLDVSYDQLRILPASISQLQNLTKLNLNGNQLSILPESISQLPNLQVLEIDGNPLIGPPIEIASKGIEAIREYFRQLEQEGVNYLYEAKLLILGEPGAGKTSLAKKILDPNYLLQEETSTVGVAVLNWSFPIEDNRQFTVNIWDFGGQEIYHSTHQFFLTKRSLYILLVDARKEDTDFHYWLNIAELLSDNSPVLIVKNEKQDRHCEMNERQLRGQFESLKEVLATNLATNRGLEDVKQEIEYHIKKLPHIGTPLPRTWVLVREALERDPRNHISLDEYISICRDNGFTKAKDSLQLSSYLHDIGVFLHFQDDPLLRKMVILKPMWGTDAVYRVLDNPIVIANLGRYTRTDLDVIWDAPEYEAKQDELLQLMMKFKLCYEIPTQKGTYIAPQLLSANQSDYQWDERENLLLRYTYEFMPKGILTQFIVTMHPYIWEHDKVWKSGIVIEQNRTRAEVVEYYSKREIHVRVAGPQARDLLTIVRHELKGVHETYKRLKYDELIRCNCSSCRDSQYPHFYAVAKLLEFRANNQLEIQCQKKPYEMVNVMKLLGDMIDLGKLPKKDALASIILHNVGDVVIGKKTMSEIKQTITNSTVHGNVVAAERIKDSFNTIQRADIKDDLKEQLKQLVQAVEAMAKDMPKEKAEDIADDMKRLAVEATKEKPNPKWFNVSIDGLITAAQNLGKVGDAVIDLAEKVRKVLTGGLL